MIAMMTMIASLNVNLYTSITIFLGIRSHSLEEEEEDKFEANENSLKHSYFGFLQAEIFFEIFFASFSLFPSFLE